MKIAHGSRIRGREVRKKIRSWKGPKPPREGRKSSRVGAAEEREPGRGRRGDDDVIVFVSVCV